MKSLEAAVLLILAFASFSKADSQEDSAEFGVEDIEGPKKTNCSCGLSNKEGDERLIGGEETVVNEFPYMAGIVYKPKKILYCGGNILTNRHVITAAHCVETLSSSIHHLEVVLGEHDQDLEDSPHRIYIDVDRALMHPDYYVLGHKNDIALLSLAEEITFTKWVAPVCLPSKPVNLVGKRVKILGWGRLTPTGPQSRKLMKAMLNIVPLEKCNASYNFIDMDERVQLCTHHPKRDSCQGDSGGPLLWHDPEINRYVLVGLTSFGKRCDAGYPAINVDIMQYIEWIQYNIQYSEPGLRSCSKVE